MAIRFHVQPRCVPPAVAARRLGVTEAHFREIAGELRQRGFPVADSVTGNYDLVAIDAWLDQRAGLAKVKNEARDAADGFEERLARIG